MNTRVFPGFVLFAAVSCIAAAEPVKLHPDNGHYLLWRGRPTILIGSTEHYGAVLNSEFDYVKYLKTLQADSMTLTRTFSGAYCEPFGAFNIHNNTLAPAAGKLLCPWARSDQDGYKGGGNKFDLTRFDAAYFARLKDFVARADKAGVVVEFVLFCPFYEDAMWDLSPMKAANNIQGVGTMKREEVYTLKHPDLLAVQDAMVRKVVAELKDFDNLYYEICNEPYFGGVTLDWQAHIAQTITDAEKPLGVRHLIAQNIANDHAKVENANPNVSIFNFHYAKPPVTVAENYALNRVIADDETGFAGSEDKTYRIEGWNFILAGGGIYDNLDYSFQVGKEDGTGEVKAPGGGSVAFRRQMRILKDFIHSFDFVRMKPDNSVVAGPLPAKASAYVLAQPGKAYALYFSGCSGPVEIKLNLPKGKYRAEWLDTKTGQVAKSDNNVDAAAAPCTLTAPGFADDIALRITGGGQP